MVVRREGLTPVASAFAGVLAGQRVAPAGFVTGAAWMPEIEDERAALRLRLRRFDAIAAARHAIAVNKSAWARDARARVLVRAAGKIMAYDAFFMGARQTVVRRRACERCGCTQDRACAGGCAWAGPALCSACEVESPHG